MLSSHFRVGVVLAFGLYAKLVPRGIFIKNNSLEKIDSSALSYSQFDRQFENLCQKIVMKITICSAAID
ncbi:hypothetical protein CRN47_09585 [Vibrio vulnificus]|nr:hypothetical protein CRN47_09585 [Vibrio vulnificus]RAH27486.1 hypothetical protein DOT36_09020 [Vibrio vulnificus]